MWIVFLHICRIFFFAKSYEVEIHCLKFYKKSSVYTKPFLGHGDIDIVCLCQGGTRLCCTCPKDSMQKGACSSDIQ